MYATVAATIFLGSAPFITAVNKALMTYAKTEIVNVIVMSLGCNIIIIMGTTSIGPPKTATIASAEGGVGMSGRNAKRLCLY